MEFVSTTEAPAAIGPYSQAVIANDVIYTSGQIGLLPNGELADEGVEKQMHQVIKNLYYVLQKAGAEFSDVLKTTLYLQDMADFEIVNEVYAHYFADHKPARSTVAVRELPKGVKVEMDCIAVVHSDSGFW